MRSARALSAMFASVLAGAAGAADILVTGFDD